MHGDENAMASNPTTLYHTDTVRPLPTLRNILDSRCLEKSRCRSLELKRRCSAVWEEAQYVQKAAWIIQFL